VVYGRCGAARLVDQHQITPGAIAAHDAVALRRAIASDISDGMGIIGASDWQGGRGAPTRDPIARRSS